MPGHDIIVIGASAGGVEALTNLVRALPATLPATIFLVLHIPASGPSVLPQILNRAGTLPARHAQQGERIQPGRIYVAPPNHHMLVKPGYILLTHGPKENLTRPAVDPLFRTAAKAYGPRVIGVVLSGVLDDGTAGLSVVKERGGIAIVQDPDDATYRGMPESALLNVDVDEVLPLSEIGPRLIELADLPVEDAEGSMMAEESEPDMAEDRASQEATSPTNGVLTDMICPSCGGVLSELRDGRNMLRFRCQVGHVFSAQSLDSVQTEYLEGALWAAARALRERESLLRRMSERARDRKLLHSPEQYEEEAAAAAENAEIILKILQTGFPREPGEGEGAGA